MATAKAVVPPASNFAELLRRSKFATFDPLIAQTYTAPPAYARRGNYGLKRSIPMPYKDSYISLASFEHHAHFTEWNNAEQQVKLVKRVEEMNVFPRYLPTSTWAKGLGEAKTQWLIDSEFCEHTYPARETMEKEVVEEKDTTEDVEAETSMEMEEVSQRGRGPGGYGSKRPRAFDRSSAQPNVEAMSPKEFQRYLAKLRQLRPQFRNYLIEQQREYQKAKLQRESEEDETPANPDFESNDTPNLDPDNLLLYVASQNPHPRHHWRFLAKRVGEDYVAPESTKIEKQPHQTGGLLYNRPSALESILHTEPQPGLVLQAQPGVAPLSRFATSGKPSPDNLALFGGIVARISGANSGVKVPLYYPENENPLAKSSAASGSSSENIENSTSGLRMVHLTVRSPPEVVSPTAARMASKDMMSSMGIHAECTTELPWAQRNVVNPYKPGSYEYSTHKEVEQSRYGMRQRHATGMAGSGVATMGTSGGVSGFSRFKRMDAENSAKRALKNPVMRSATNGGTGEEWNKNFVATLSNIVKKNRRPTGGGGD